MNWDQIEGSWKELKGTVREKWAKLTDDDFEAVAGDKDKLLGKLQKRYGYKKNQAESELNHWLSSLDRNRERQTEH